MDLALNNLQRLICCKTHQTKPNQTKLEENQLFIKYCQWCIIIIIIIIIIAMIITIVIMCKKFKFDNMKKWYLCNPESICSIATIKAMCEIDFTCS